MEIQYLKILKDYPAAYPNDPEYEARIEGVSEDTISQLEQKYNNINPFPKALKELLYLAGKYCYVLDYNIFETQQELQEAVREWLSEKKLSINRPFFAIDAYNYGEAFLFIYLDEGDNPIVRQAYLFPRKDMPFISNLLGQSLSGYIKGQIDDVKQGINPF